MVILEMEEVVGSQDKQQSYGGDSDLADSSHNERPRSLFEEILQVCPQTYAGEGEQECPAAEVP